MISRCAVAKTLKGALLLFVLLHLVGCSSSNPSAPQQSPPQAVNGVLDLRNWDFERDGPLNLTGDWAFYWQELIPPEQIQDTNPQNYFKVPQIWTGKVINGEKLSPQGYATFALTVLLPQTSKIYGLHLRGEGTAYTLWVNNVILAQNGKVGTSQEAMIAESKPQVVFFQADSETVNFVIQISNFDHRKGGFRNEIRLGMSKDIQAEFTRQNVDDAVIMGIYLVLGLYHLFIFAFRAKNKAPFYFMLWCFSTAIRAGVTNQNLLTSLFPVLHWAAALRLEYLTFYLVSPLYALFIYSLYPEDFNRRVVQITIVIAAIFSIGMLFVSTLVLSYTATIYQAILLLEICYFVYVLWKILARRREGAVIIGLASLIGISGVILEILYLQNILPFGKGAPTYGFLGFIFAQAILLSSRFSKSFHRVEILSADLELTNIHLKESERKYRTIFEDAKDLIFIAGLDEQVEEVNPSCEEIFGYTQDEMMTKKILDFVVHPEDKTQVENLIFTQGFVKDHELELRKKDGEIISSLVSMNLRKDAEGNVTGVQGIVHDISARKQADTERVRALKFERMAFTDGLTGTYNRRFFNEIAEKELARANRIGTPLSIILFDIDHFKHINDTYGHSTGDNVLIQLANLCKKHLRNMDVFARYGGEEFVILMPDTPKKFASQTAERLREIIAKSPMTKVNGTILSITISLGVSTLVQANLFTLQSLLEQADEALYQSKQMGRNRMTVYESPLQQ